jgi:hypothetical protein
MESIMLGLWSSFPCNVYSLVLRRKLKDGYLREKLKLRGATGCGCEPDPAVMFPTQSLRGFDLAGCCLFLLTLPCTSLPRLGSWKCYELTTVIWSGNGDGCASLAIQI